MADNIKKLIAVLRLSIFDAPLPQQSVFLHRGAIAQLVARLHGMQEVTSSTLVSSTSLRSYELRLAGQPNGRDCQAEIVRAKAARRSS